MNKMHSKHRQDALSRWPKDHVGRVADSLRSSNWKNMATDAKNQAGKCIARHPVLSVAAALSMGAIAGWFVKRK